MRRITFRDAAESDSDFVFAVGESALRRYVELTWGPWEPIAQRRMHEERFEAQRHRIILADGEQVGVVVVIDYDGYVQLETLFLLAQFQNQGIGASVLKTVIEGAAARGKPVRLRVLRVNEGAQRFYLRHGFIVTETTPQRVFMEASTVPETRSLTPAPLPRAGEG